MASYFAASLLVALVVSVTTIAGAPSPSAVDGDIASTTQEMQQARYFTFVMLIRMVQEQIPRNTTFLMPSDRLLSTASVPGNQVLDLLLRHSVPAVLMFADLNRLPNGTVVPTRHTNQMVTITKREHRQLYFNNIELTSPDICRGGDSFRCHGINGVLRPTATRRGRGAACPRSNAPTTAAPEPASAANQSLGTPSLTPGVVSATSPAVEPTESSQSSDTSASRSGLSCTTLILVLMISIF
ncbi:hypothetical protein BRADI_4g39640v3 [Brachypodium distachyon]|uniref:FAS1 domain-containing protein n=1 Tax=Brachypodium distachyon TaxID=15368 RepID=I1ITE9_BRADI|nr:hypothetical protein BRADI_4g39640v3 [Brachypodium distachyon]